MKYLFIILSTLGVFLSIASQLEVTAQTTSDKTITFASDIESAIPCATAGIPIDQCATFDDFDADIAAYEQQLNEINDKMLALQFNLTK